MKAQTKSQSTNIKKIGTYRFIFDFLASPADDLWHYAKLES